MSAFLNCDYSNIEARLICWLAGQEDALREYQQGVDRYKRMAAMIYGIPEGSVNEHPQRFLGKTAILGCGYGMGPKKFRESCAKMGYELPAGLEEKAVQSYRAKHKKVVQYWYALERAMKHAIINKGEVVKLGNIAFQHKDLEGMPFCLLRLPSGRKLSYPKPRISGESITYFGHQIGTQWGDVTTYSGKIAENICQGVAADVMAHGTHNCERAGYKIVTLIHDEAVAIHEEGQTAERFEQLLTALPPWLKDFPIAAKGKMIPFYKK